MTANRAARRSAGVGALAYLGFFLLVFAPLLQRDALPGSCDTWLLIAVFNALRMRVASWLSGAAVPQAMYPAHDWLGFGDAAPGLGLPFGLARVLTGSDVRAEYALLAGGFALQAWALRLLTLRLGASPRSAMAASLVGASLSPLFGNIDDPQVALLGLATLALAEAVAALQTGEARHRYAAAALTALQVYVGVYQAVFLLGLLAALLGRQAWGARSLRLGPLVGPALLAAAILAPFVSYYAASTRDPDLYNPWSDGVLIAEINSLEPADLLRAAPGHGLFPSGPVTMAETQARVRALSRPSYHPNAELTSREALADQDLALRTLPAPGDSQDYLTTRRAGWLGLSVWGLVGLALARRRTSSHFWALAVLVSFIMALGPFATVRHTTLAAPMFPFYRYIPFAHWLRVPLRAWVFATIPVGVLLAHGFDSATDLVAERLGAGAVLPVTAVLAALALVENLPRPIPTFDAAALEAPTPLVDYFGDQRGHVLLNLPSRIGGGLTGRPDGLTEYAREGAYANWMSAHGQSTVNGVNGYLSRHRLEAQRLIERLPSRDALADLLRGWNIDTIVVSPDLAMPWDTDLTPWLRSCDLVHVRLQVPGLTVFEVDRRALARGETTGG